MGEKEEWIKDGAVSDLVGLDSKMVERLCEVGWRLGGYLAGGMVAIVMII